MHTYMCTYTYMHITINLTELAVAWGRRSFQVMLGTRIYIYI